MLTLKPHRDTVEEIVRNCRMDANEAVFFQTALEYVKTQTFPVIYKKFSAFELFPMNSEGGPGAKTIVYRSEDGAGKARIIASYGDDLPKVGVSATEQRSPIVSIGASYGWSVQDVRSAMLGGYPLESRLAMETVKAHNEKMNDIAWAGDSAFNLPGLKTQTTSTTQAAITGDWLTTATADQIIADVNEALTSIVTATNGSDSADTIIMPPEQYAALNSKARSTTSDTSVLGFLRMAWPEVTFMSALETKDWSGSDDAFVAMRRDAQHVTMEVPQPYEEFPVERHALRFEVATHSRFGGLLVYYPKSVAVRTGI